MEKSCFVLMRYHSFIRWQTKFFYFFFFYAGRIGTVENQSNVIVTHCYLFIIFITFTFMRTNIHVNENKRNGKHRGITVPGDLLGAEK